MYTNTAHKKIETALQESNECFHAIFDQTAVGFTYMALDGRFLRVNQKFCDIVGYSRDELLQRTRQEITYLDDLDPDLSCIRGLLKESSNSYMVDKRFIRQDGERVWVEVTFSLE